MASGGAAGDSGENLSPMIPNDKVSDDRHTGGEAVWAALVIMFISNGGYEQQNNLEAEKKTVNTSSRAHKKYRSLAEIYAKDEGNIVASSYEQILNAGLLFSMFSFLWAVRIALIITPDCYSLTTKDVIRRVTHTFEDAHPLEMMVPLQDLVKAALNIFSSQPRLAVFKTDTRNWSWTGPILSHAAIDITTPEAWGLSDKMLNKLVESFTEWVKAKYSKFSRIVLRLPNPPPAATWVSFTVTDQPTLEERFKSTRYIRSSNICTILPRSDQVIAYFHKEEEFRYFIPERAFEYTTADAKKATVAPLRMCSNKSKTREHFILKPNRPSAFSVLCLVRDAAARLPDNVGTIADICSLVKDSQYIQVEHVSDDQLKQVVSRALDRLHYELDPCVKYSKDTHLWTYRHAERVEDDFTPDCTSSTMTKNRRIQ